MNGVNERAPDTAAGEGSRSQVKRKKGKFRVRKQKRQRYVLLAVILVLVAVIIGMLGIISRNPLSGSWRMDSVTVYRFENDGTGELILPTSNYEFTYTAKDGTLNIDFSYEGAKDASYEYEIQGDILTLNGGNATNRGVYKLSRNYE